MNELLEKEILHYLSKKNIYYKQFSNELVVYLSTLYPNLSLKAQWYLYSHNITDLPICEYDGCNNYVKFNEKKKVLDKGCCKTHNQKITFKVNYGEEHPLKNKKQLLKLKNSVKEKYGVDSIAQLETTKQKIKETTKEKYGVNSIAELTATKTKSRKTMLLKYGVEFAQQSKQIREKTHQTNLSKFGVTEPLTDSKFRERAHQTNIDKYGSIFPMRNKELLAKRLETVIDKYDSYSPLGNPEVNKKFRKTVFEKYYNTKLLKNTFFKPLFTLEEYIGTVDSNSIGIDYKWLCLVCDTEFVANISAGHIPTCPKCHPRIFNISKLETELFNSIDVIDKTQSVRGLIGQKEIDIYIESLHIGIEFNGMYWHSEQKGKLKDYHLDKTIQAENAGIDLIHVFEYEWINKKDTILSIINRKLQLSYSIDISLLMVQTVEKDEKTKFMNENYLFGDDQFISHVHGLYHNNILVAIMTVSNNEIKHFIIKNAIGIDGNGFRKLFESFKFKNQIIYSVDRRFNEVPTNYIIDSGFTFEGSSEPNMYYSKKNIMVHHSKVDFGNILTYVTQYNNILSIKENMIANGYLTIWDCGKRIYKSY